MDLKDLKCIKTPETIPGTAATVSVMCTIGFKNCDFDLPSFDTWTVAPKIKTTLENLRRGYSEDPYGWNIPV